MVYFYLLVHPQEDQNMELEEHLLMIHMEHRLD
jgi:hypothetical protein